MSLLALHIFRQRWPRLPSALWGTGLMLMMTTSSLATWLVNQRRERATLTLNYYKLSFLGWSCHWMCMSYSFLSYVGVNISVTHIPLSHWIPRSDLPYHLRLRSSNSLSCFFIVYYKAPCLTTRALIVLLSYPIRNIIVGEGMIESLRKVSVTLLHHLQSLPSGGVAWFVVVCMTGKHCNMLFSFPVHALQHSLPVLQHSPSALQHAMHPIRLASPSIPLAIHVATLTIHLASLSTCLARPSPPYHIKTVLTTSGIIQHITHPALPPVHLLCWGRHHRPSLRQPYLPKMHCLLPRGMLSEWSGTTWPLRPTRTHSALHSSNPSFRYCAGWQLTLEEKFAIAAKPKTGCPGPRGQNSSRRLRRNQRHANRVLWIAISTHIYTRTHDSNQGGSARQLGKWSSAYNPAYKDLQCGEQEWQESYSHQTTAPHHSSIRIHRLSLPSANHQPLHCRPHQTPVRTTDTI